MHTMNRPVHGARTQYVDMYLQNIEVRIVRNGHTFTVEV